MLQSFEYEMQMMGTVLIVYIVLPMILSFSSIVSKDESMITLMSNRFWVRFTVIIISKYFPR